MREGKLRAAGVSNFDLAQLRELVRTAEIKPAVVQSNSGEGGGGERDGSACELPGPQPR